MSRTPINPRLLRSRRSLEEMRILGEARQALAAVFLPFLSATVRERLRTYLETPVPFTPEDRVVIKELGEVLRGERPAFSDPIYTREFDILQLDDEKRRFFRSIAQSGSLDSALAELEKELRDPSPVSEERLDAYLLSLAQYMTAGWIGMLLAAMERDSSVCSIDEGLLGPGFANGGVPPIPHPEPACEGFVLTSDEFRAVLRQVKASLPQGKLLPDAAMTLLSMHGVTAVIPIKRS